MTPDEAVSWFGYRDGTAEQVAACIRVRSLFAQTAGVIAELVPESPDQLVALRKLKDACQATIGAIVAPEPHREILENR